MAKKISARISLFFNSTALTDAVRQGNALKVADLLELGVDPNKGHPLTVAIEAGNKEIAGLLIDKGADMYAKDMNGLAPIEHTLKYRALKPEMLELLIEKKLDPNKALDDEKKWMPLHLAADRGKPEIIDALIKAGADINAQTIHGETALHRACSMRIGKDVAEALIKNGARTDIKDGYGRTAQDVAKQHRFAEAAALFLPKAETAAPTAPAPVPIPAIVPPPAT